MAINFPSSPTNGQLFSSGGAIWKWDGVKWIPAASGQNYLPLTGGSLTGDLTITTNDSTNLKLNAPSGQWPGIELNIPASGNGAWIGSYVGGNERWEIDLGNGVAEGAGNIGSNFQIGRYANNGAWIDDPILIQRSSGLVSFSQHAPVNDSSYNAADTYWVMNQLAGRSNRNRLINGNFTVNQWNNGTVITPVSTQFLIDRWRCTTLTQAGKFTSAIGGTGVGAAPSAYYLALTSTSAYASLAADVFSIIQNIEYLNVGDLGWGTANARPVTLSFWAGANVAGTYSGTIRNGAATRTYPFTFNITAINTWQYFTITIPGDTAGTWIVAPNTSALGVVFDLGCGSTSRGPAGAWSGGAYNGATGSVSLVATNGGTLSLTNIQLEVGSQATPYDLRNFADELALCQRYYQTAFANVRNYFSVVTGAWVETTINYNFMRAAPTAAILTVGSAGNLASGSPLINTPTQNGVRWGIQAAAVGDCYALTYIISLNAEL